MRLDCRATGQGSNVGEKQSKYFKTRFFYTNYVILCICRMEEFGNKVTKLQQTLARNKTPARNNKNATAKQVPVIIITLPLFSSSSW
ncbi:hypothetical protein E1A91_A06G087400v1 [Gossypium mustelinum]|uniref:Uncharacterized protein n=1 Tax=Gossypium mustelinum TaxID=34275 RepID=A0A5D2YVB1_GOSMU|nr:hypothetical protein E1A91_A06G087400v1 [Gossypium mustelinum]